MTPRLFVDLPVGLQFLAVGYGYSSGNVLFDSTLPIEGAQARVNSGVLRYIATLPVGRKAGRIEVSVPHAWSYWQGQVQGQPAETQRTGFADPTVRFAVNFVGAPPLDLRAFHGYRPKWAAGAGLQVILPLGEYDGGDLINLGSNRWTFRPQIGFSRAWTHWMVDMNASVFLFTDNPDALGNRLAQEAVVTLETNLSYTFRPGLWLAFDALLADGGRTTVNGEQQNTLEKNTRVGLTLALPLGHRDGLQMSFAHGVTTRIGADFNNYIIAWQHMWGGKGH